MVISARKVAQLLAKNKATQRYIVKKDTQIEYALSLALPGFLRDNPAYLQQPFDLESVIKLQAALLLYATRHGHIEQMMRERSAGFKSEIEFLKVIFGDDQVSSAFSEGLLDSAIQHVVAVKMEELRSLKTLSRERVLELFAEEASTWAVQQYSEGKLTIWQVLNREPLLLIFNW